jgi:hypothetical protein
MNQVDERRRYANLAEVVEWAIGTAWLSRSRELTIVPGPKGLDGYQTVNVYVVNGKPERFSLRPEGSKTRYTASFYVYAD